MRKRQERTSSVVASSGSTGRVGRFKAKEQRRAQGHFDAHRKQHPSDDTDDYLSGGMSRLTILNVVTPERKNNHSSRPVEAIPSEVRGGKALPGQASASSPRGFLEHGDKSIPNDKILEKIKAAAKIKMKEKITPKTLSVAVDEVEESRSPPPSPPATSQSEASMSPSRSHISKSKSKTKKSREYRSKGDRMKSRQLMPKKSRSAISVKIKPATSSEDLYSSNLAELQKAATKYNNSWYTFGVPPAQALVNAEARDARHASSKREDMAPREARVEPSQGHETSFIRHTHDDEDSIDKEEQYTTFVSRLRRVSKKYREDAHQTYTGTNQVTDPTEKVLPQQQYHKSNEHHAKKNYAPSRPYGRNHSRANHHRSHPRSDLAKKSYEERYAVMEDDESIPSQFSNDDSFQRDGEAAFSSFSRGSLDDQSMSATSAESVEEGWMSWFDKW